MPVAPFSLFLGITAKEYLCTQQHPQGSRQRDQEGEENKVCFTERHGSQVLTKPKVCQEVQQEEALRVWLSCYEKLLWETLKRSGVSWHGRCARVIHYPSTILSSLLYVTYKVWYSNTTQLYATSLLYFVPVPVPMQLYTFQFVGVVMVRMWFLILVNLLLAMRDGVLSIPSSTSCIGVR